MISGPGALILALISERPMSAYELIGVLETVNVRRWMQISDSTVYATVKVLERKGYIEGKAERTGNMPEKTVYSIAESGEKVLKTTLATYLESSLAANPEFDIAVLFLCHLDKTEAAALLESKRTRLEAEIRRTEEQEKLLQADGRIPFIGRSMVRHNRFLKEAELRSVRELIEETASAERWDFFVGR